MADGIKLVDKLPEAANTSSARLPADKADKAEESYEYVIHQPAGTQALAVSCGHTGM